MLPEVMLPEVMLPEATDRVDERAAVHAALADPHRLRMVDALWLSDLMPGELASRTGLSSSLLAFHLRVLQEAGLIERHRSEGDGRRRYISLRPARLDRIAFAAPIVAGPVLFVCTRNAARSQMAAALWRRDGRTAFSAGTDPAQRIHPLAVTVARAHGLDLADVRPCGYAEVDVDPSLVVSVCDRARESALPFDARHVHWSVADPAGGTLADFERAFAAIAERVERLAAGAAA